MTQPTDGAADQPATHQPTPDEPSSDATRELPQQDTAAIPVHPAHDRPDTHTAAPADGVPFTDEPAPRGRRRTAVVIGAVAAVAVLGTAGVVAFTALSGGGTQPAEVLPSDAYFYARLDIDPSAGQKLAAVRFLDKIPQIKDIGSGDPRQKLWELATKDADACVKKVSYDDDIAPWIGERAGLALRPGGTADAPNAVVALQVSDESRAKDELTTLLACGDGDKPDVRVKNGYALMTLPGKGDDLVAAIDKGTLASNATFAGDVEALGEQGVFSMWGDLNGLFKDMGNLAPEVAATPGFKAEEVKGRYAAAIRFDPSFVELSGIARGLGGQTALASAAGDSKALGTLPADTVAALHVSNADKQLASAWPQLEKQIKEAAAADGEGDVMAMIEEQLGITLPDDLEALLGSSFTLAVPQQDFDNDTPVFGAKVVSSKAARAEEVLTTLEGLAGSDLLTTQVDGDHLYVATTSDYADQLKTTGTLGQSEAFTVALGDLSKSSSAFFVDLDRIEKLYLDGADADARAALEALRAVGGTTSVTGSDQASFTLRVVGN